MSKIIYAVSSGEYSDYRVHCVFSTKELAQVYKDYLMQDEGYYDVHEIEEYELDDMNGMANLIKKGYKNYELKIDRNGNTSEIEININSWFNAPQIWIRDNSLTVRCWAKDEKHAVKIANEIRVQLIALNIPFEEKAHKNFTDEQKELMNEILNKNIKKLI